MSLALKLAAALGGAAGGGGGDGDPYFSSVVSLMHFNGNLTDVRGHTWTATGSVAADGTAKFGSNALNIPATGASTNRLTGDGSADFGFGTGDFTVELWANISDLQPTSISVLWDMRVASVVQNTIYLDNTNIYYYSNGANRITAAFSSYNTYVHIALSRKSGTSRLFVNGTQVGSNYTDSYDMASGAGNPTLGNTNLSTNNLLGYIDELRVTKGVGRYTANFTAPTEAFPDTPPTLSYRYLRIACPISNIGGCAAYQEIRWLVNDAEYPPTMTAYNAPSPLVATESGYSYTGSPEAYGMWRAFDRNNGTWFSVYYDVVGHGTIDLGADHEIMPTGIAITPYLGYSPSEFTCYGSNTGAFAGEEDTLYYASTPSGWSAGTRRDFTF